MDTVVCEFSTKIHHPLCADHDNGALGQVDLYTKATNAYAAIRLIQLGARTALVCQLTGLERLAVRHLYHQLRRSAPPPGQTPFTDVWYLEHDLRMLHAAVVWRLYRRFAETRRAPSHLLVDVYESYLCLVRTPVLDLTRAAFVPRLVTMKLWHENSCRYCETSYLAPADDRRRECPGCRLYHRYRCRQCGATLNTKSLGRPRTVCGRCKTLPKQTTQH